MRLRACELCDGEANLYCPSDSAFLCWNCDHKVHEANFLVARHLRVTVCSKCKSLSGNSISGAGFSPFPAICHSCSSASPTDDVNSLSSLSSSACVSSTQSCATSHKKFQSDRRKSGRFGSSTSVNDSSGEVTSGMSKASHNRKLTTRSGVPSTSDVDPKAESIFVSWCRKLGISDDTVVQSAGRSFRVCSNILTVLPFRVSLAASLWFGLRFCSDRSILTWHALKRLEQISGVPAKLILIAGSKLERVLKMRKERRHQLRLQEGWAECSA